MKNGGGVLQSSIDIIKWLSPPSFYQTGENHSPVWSLQHLPPCPQLQLCAASRLFSLKASGGARSFFRHSAKIFKECGLGGGLCHPEFILAPSLKLRFLDQGTKTKAERQFLENWRTASLAGASASGVVMSVTFIRGGAWMRGKRFDC